MTAFPRTILVIIFILVSNMIYGSPLSEETNGYDDEESPSIINLIATPERYHGEKIFVTGWVYVGYEIMSLCFAERVASSRECLWIEIHDQANSEFGRKNYEEKLKILESSQHKVISLRGTFNMNNTGHIGGWSVQLKKSQMFIQQSRLK